MKSRNPKIEFDELQLYFGEPYVIDLENADGSITIHQPTIGQILHIGEKRFYSTLNIFITNTTQYRLFLWENGYDWNVISDFNLFYMLIGSVDPEVTKIMFPNIDFSNFKLYLREYSEDDKRPVLYDFENKIEINEEVYFHISQYLRAVFAAEPEEKITLDDTLKQWYIEKDKAIANNDQIKNNGYSIRPIISACVNHPGFKYKLKELKEVGVCEFYDSVNRLQVYESATAVMKGLYSGMVDGKKIKPDQYNFMKPI